MNPATMRMMSPTRSSAPSPVTSSVTSPVISPVINSVNMATPVQPPVPLIAQQMVTRNGLAENQVLSSPYSQTEDNTGDNSWLRTNLLGVIATYNKMIKARTLARKGSAYMSTQASNYWNKQNESVPEIESAKAKREYIISQALNSLLPNNYMLATGKSIADAGALSYASGVGKTVYNKTSQMGNRAYTGMRNLYNSTFRRSPQPGVQGGKLRRKGTRKHRKSKK
jgi:hypothetical protein